MNRRRSRLLISTCCSAARNIPTCSCAASLAAQPCGGLSVFEVAIARRFRNSAESSPWESRPQSTNRIAIRTAQPAVQPAQPATHRMGQRCWLFEKDVPSLGPKSHVAALCSRSFPCEAKLLNRPIRRELPMQPDKSRGESRSHVNRTFAQFRCAAAIPEERRRDRSPGRRVASWPLPLPPKSSSSPPRSAVNHWLCTRNRADICTKNL